MTYALDQGFGAAVLAAGLGGLPFAWDMDGNIFLDESLTETQIVAIKAAAAAYKPAG
ncbi:hypothetical protein PWR63_23710 [Paraburkholderia sp. A2WS-5]|uniref:hypothetical protein n=1 Tax=Paraburkholderia sp. A2WS-5 TaxID=3028372 RepID=UPI003B7FD241